MFFSQSQLGTGILYQTITSWLFPIKSWQSTAAAACHP